MSILDPNLGKGAGKSIPSVSPKNVVSSGADLGKDALNNALDNVTGQITDKINDKLADLTAPIQEGLDKAKNVANKAKEVASMAQSYTNIIPGDLSTLPDGLITPEQLAKYKGLDSLIATYGGDPEVSLANSHIVYSKIMIGGERVLADSHFVVEINQKIAEHDTFTITCASDAIDGKNAYPMETARSFLGKRTTIQFMQFGQAALVYTGIITNIANVRENGESKLVFTGKAPTILLENGLDSQSFEKKDLAGIVKAATSEYPQDLVQWDVRPAMTESLLYTVQYRESDWDFIKRLATRYGEWFYYDGQQIVFGPYGGTKYELVEEQDVYDCKLQMELVPQKFSYMAYDAKQAKPYTVESESVPITHSLVNPFQQHAIQASKDIFSKVPSSLYNHSLLESGVTELKGAVKRQKLKRQNVFFMEAKTNKPNLRVGDTVQLKAWMPGHQIFKNGEVPLESYRILEIKHFHDITEGYYNRIIGIPRDNEVPPYMNEDAFPACEEQSAIVMDNNDKEGMSRIRVQFPWQKPFGGQTPWIRSITPYAGGGKGMHVVPEIGEEVIVTFENGNAEKPVSLGAMFNGKGKSGHGGAGNNIKGLQTRSGSHILFHDGTGFTKLADHGLSNLTFDGKGNASVSTSVTQTVTVGGSEEAPDGQAKLLMDNAGNIELKGKTKIKLSVGENSITITKNGIKINSDEGYIELNSMIWNKIKAGTIELTTEGYIDLTSTGNTTIKANRVIEN